MERIHTVRAALEALIAPLTDDEMVAPGPDGGWSVKDHLMHIVAWDRALLGVLQDQPIDRAIGIDGSVYETGGIDAVNAAIYERERDRPLPEVLAAWRASRREVLALLETLSDADLYERPYMPDYPGDGRPVIDGVVGNTYAHDEEHIEWIRTMLDARKNR
jgi:uncharacterized protein (TIGR03083 family)